MKPSSKLSNSLPSSNANASERKLSALMGFNNQTLKHFFAFLLILFAFLLVSSSCPGSCNEILPKINTEPNANLPATAYQVLRIKNATPFFLNKPEFDNKGKGKTMKRRKINKNSFGTRPFSVMLPKGFVPHSGSSPCQNGKPDSSVAHTLFCGLFTNTAKP